jgi:hypothetical protein
MQVTTSMRVRSRTVRVSPVRMSSLGLVGVADQARPEVHADALEALGQDLQIPAGTAPEVDQSPGVRPVQLDQGLAHPVSGLVT